MGRIRIVILWLIVLASAVGVACLFGPWTSLTKSAHQTGEPAGLGVPQDGKPGQPADSVQLSQRAVLLNGIRTAKAARPTTPRELKLRGSLGIDPGRLVHVHARFPGQIVEIATIEETDPERPESGTRRRPLKFMDRVKKGDRLAVVWSRDLGEKKSELIDSLIRYWVDEKTHERFMKLNEKGSISDRELREAKRQVDLDKTAVRRAQRTLRAWFLTEREIDEVVAEARQMHHGLERNEAHVENAGLDANWARVDVVAAMDGTIVEKNIVRGDIVDPNDDLFKLADLSELVAWAHVYEEDLPLLHSLATPVRWKVRVNANPGIGDLVGYIDGIGDVVDPNEHMALVSGMIPNPNGELIAGQFITATVELAMEDDVVVIPARALVEDGVESVVLVQDKDEHTRFVKRRVAVVRRFSELVYVRSRLDRSQTQEGLEELHEGESVVAVGALELKAAIAR